MPSDFIKFVITQKIIFQRTKLRDELKTHHKKWHKIISDVRSISNISQKLKCIRNKNYVIFLPQLFVQPEIRRKGLIIIIQNL
jgi:hypothetical protein